MSSNENHIGLSKYDIHFMGNVYEMSPQSLIFKNSNAMILQRCKSGLVREKLQGMDVKIIENQIQGLLELQLLKIEDNRLITNFPIIEREISDLLRKWSKNIAEKMTIILKAQLLKLKNRLFKLGFESNIYSILFSYILDYLVWYNLDYVQGIMKYINCQNPFLVWAFMGYISTTLFLVWNK